MKKRISIIFVLVLLVFTSGVLASSTIKEIVSELRMDFNIVVDGEKQTFKDVNGVTVYPILYDGTTYLPVRAISEMFGKIVRWDADTNSIFIDEPNTGVVENDIRETTDKDTEKIAWAITVLKKEFGEKDKTTGFPYNYICNEIVTDNITKNAYYVIWMQWLVDNSHYSTINQFLVSVEGEEIYEGYYNQKTGEFGLDKKVVTEAMCDSSNLIKTENYDGAILFINGEENWVPNKQIISDFETKLVPYVNDFKNLGQLPGNGNGLQFMKENIKKYKRQYIGRLENGNKILYCNFLFIDDSNSFGDWTKEYIEVNDGGAYFFNISYDIQTKELFNFYINGEA